MFAIICTPFIKRRAHAVNWDLKKRKAHAVSWDLKKRRAHAVSWDRKMARWATPVSPFIMTEKERQRMENLRIYRISDHYIRFLRGKDSKVQYNKGNRRPYVGVVLKVGGCQYFVPMESPKENHKNIKPGKHILRLDGGSYGQLGFNNMVPVHKDALILFDINAEPDEAYRELLKRQATICNRMKADILDRAHRTYFDVVNQKNKFLMSISCDFKALEAACKSYNKDYKPKKKKDPAKSKSD